MWSASGSAITSWKPWRRGARRCARARICSVPCLQAMGLRANRTYIYYTVCLCHRRAGDQRRAARTWTDQQRDKAIAAAARWRLSPYAAHFANKTVPEAPGLRRNKRPAPDGATTPAVVNRSPLRRVVMKEKRKDKLLRALAAGVPLPPEAPPTAAKRGARAEAAAGRAGRGKAGAKKGA